MTRDQWTKKFAQRLMDVAGIDHGSAAAYASDCANQQAIDNGINPAGWDAPADYADEEMSCWDSGQEKKP